MNQGRAENSQKKIRVEPTFLFNSKFKTLSHYGSGPFLRKIDLISERERQGMAEMELIIFGVIRVSISCHQGRLHLRYCDSIAKRETSGKRKKSQRWYLLFVAFLSIIMSLSMNSLLREARWILLVSFTRSSIY